MNQIKIVQIRFVVYSKAVEGNPSFDRYAEGSNLFTIDPDPPVQRVLFPLHSKIFQRAENDFLELVNISDETISIPL